MSGRQLKKARKLLKYRDTLPMDAVLPDVFAILETPKRLKRALRLAGKAEPGETLPMKMTAKQRRKLKEVFHAENA